MDYKQYRNICPLTLQAFTSVSQLAKHQLMCAGCYALQPVSQGPNIYDQHHLLIYVFLHAYKLLDEMAVT